MGLLQDLYDLLCVAGSYVLMGSYQKGGFILAGLGAQSSRPLWRRKGQCYRETRGLPSFPGAWRGGGEVGLVKQERERTGEGSEGRQ